MAKWCDGRIAALLMLSAVLGIASADAREEFGTRLSGGVPSGSATESEPLKVIIDADPAIGVPFKDVDDGLMILAALNSPEIDILGITTTYGNAPEKTAYEKAKELRLLAGRTDVPVLHGATSARDRDPTEASRFIATMASEYPGEVTVLAVGPVTNVATALRHSPNTAPNLREIVSMGGNVSAANVANEQCWSDLNYGSDKEAAGVFLESMDDLTVVSIQVSERFYISPSRYERLTQETEYADYFARTTRLWYWLRRRAFVVWDLVALACIVHPEWFQSNDVGIDYGTTLTGEPTLKASGRIPDVVTVNIPKYAGDQTRFWDWVFTRL